MLWPILLILSFTIPTILAGYFLPANILDSLLHGSRWAVTLVLVIGTLIGITRIKLAELIKDASDVDSTRMLDLRFRAVNNLSHRLDGLLVIAVFLSIVMYFLGTIHDLLPEHAKNFVAAVPLGGAGFIICILLYWRRWNQYIANARHKLVINKRRKEETKSSLDRLHQPRENSSESSPPKILEVADNNHQHPVSR